MPEIFANQFQYIVLSASKEASLNQTQAIAEKFCLLLNVPAIRPSKTLDIQGVTASLIKYSCSIGSKRVEDQISRQFVINGQVCLHLEGLVIRKSCIFPANY